MPELLKELQAAGMGHVLVVCGGIIPVVDHSPLREAGVAAIYGPGTRVPAAALDMLSLLLDDPSVKQPQPVAGGA